MYFIPLITSLSFASEPAHYSPVQITNESSLFAQSAAFSAPKMEKLQTNMRQINKDLIKLSLNAELLGLTDQDHWTQQERASIKRYFLKSNYFLMTIQEDYSVVYTNAMERAMAPYSKSFELSECQISRVDQMAGRVADCPGVNLTPDIIAAMDTDQSLIGALKEIELRTWPEFSAIQDTRDLVVITGNQYSVEPGVVAKALLPDRLRIAQETFEDNVAPLESKIDNGDPNAIEQAQIYRNAYQDQIKEVGVDVSNAIGIAVSKAGKKDDRLNNLGYCVQPERFGGCDSDDLTAEVITLIQQNKKALKALR